MQFCCAPVPLALRTPSASGRSGSSARTNTWRNNYGRGLRRGHYTIICSTVTEAFSGGKPLGGAARMSNGLARLGGESQNGICRRIRGVRRSSPESPRARSKAEGMTMAKELTT